MYSVIGHQAGTLPKLLTVGGNSNLEYRKWATFYMNKGRAELFARNIKEDPELSGMFEIEFSDRIGEKLESGGRDWNPCMPDAKTKLTYDDELVLTLDMQV